MKYIDADKLIAEIEMLKEKYGNHKAKNEVEKCYKGGRLIGYEDALCKIASLQQEQPDGLNKAAVECKVQVNGMNERYLVLNNPIIPNSTLKEGDKVKLIILKEDE